MNHSSGEEVIKCMTMYFNMAVNLLSLNNVCIVMYEQSFTEKKAFDSRFWSKLHEKELNVGKQL